MLKNAQELMTQWMQDGTVDALYESYKGYSQGGEFNDYRGTIMLESARKHKDFLGMSDEEISENPILTQTFITMAKMAEYAGKGVDEAISNQDTNAGNLIVGRQKKIAQDLQNLTNYSPENRESFIQSFAELTAIKDGKASTFGETTTFDDVKHDVGFVDDLTHSFMDASVFSNVIELMASDEWKEKRATEKELLRTTNAGSMIASIAGSVGAFAVEAFAFSKLAGAAFGQTKRAAQVSDYLRYGAQGFVLPMMQNINEQQGLTQKYVGENEIENSWFKNTMDGAHNVLGMFIGDKYLTPLIGRAIGTKPFKAQKLLRNSLFKAEKDIAGGMDVKQALDAARLSIDKIPALKKEAQNIMNHIVKNGNKLDKRTIENAFTEGLKISSKKDLLMGTPLFAIGDLVADYSFDIATHNAMSFAGIGFTVHQDRMFDWDKLTEGSGEMFISGLSQRVGMRVGSKVLGAVKEAVSIKEGDLATTSHLAGTSEYYQSLGVEGADTKPFKVLTWLHGFIGEDFTRKIDVELQRKTGMTLKEAATSTDPKVDILNMVNAWYSRNYASQRGLVGMFKMMDGETDTKWDDIEVADVDRAYESRGLEPQLMSVIANITKQQELRVKDLGLKEAQDLAREVLGDDWKNLDDLRKNFLLKDLSGGDAKDLNTASKIVDTTAGAEDGNTITKKVAKKLASAFSVLEAKSDKDNMFVNRVYAEISREIKNRLDNLYQKGRLVNEEGIKLGEDKKNFQIDMEKDIAKMISGNEGPRVALSEADLNDMRKRLETIIPKHKIESGPISSKQKNDAILNARGQLDAIKGKHIDLIDKNIDTDTITSSIIGIAKRIIESKDLTDMKLSDNIYKDVDTLVKKEAKALLNQHRVAIEEAVNSKILDETGKQRRVYIATNHALNLVKNVGYGWKSEATEFANYLSTKEVSELLRDGGNNKKLFEYGFSSKLKKNMQDDPDYINKMTNEMMANIYNYAGASERLFAIGDKNLRASKQVGVVLGVEDTKEESASVRAMTPLFHWNAEVDEVNMDRVVGLEGGRILNIYDDSLANTKYIDMDNTPRNIRSLDLSKADVLQVISAAAIKGLDISDKVSLNIDIEGIQGSRPSSNRGNVFQKDGVYELDLDMSGFDMHNEDHLNSAYNFAKTHLENRKTPQPLKATYGSGMKSSIYDYNGDKVTISGFFKNLAFNSPIPNLSMIHVTKNLLAKSKNHDDAVEKVMNFIGVLDKDTQNTQNKATVKEMTSRFITEQAGNFAQSTKIDLVLKNVDKRLKISTSNVQIDDSPVGDIAEFTNGNVKTVNIEFDEDIDFNDRNTLQFLEDMNIIPLNRGFKNTLDPIWIKVKELGSSRYKNNKEGIFMRDTLTNAMEERLSRNALTKDTAERIILDDTYKPTSFEGVILKELYHTHMDTDGLKFIEPLLVKAKKFEQKQLSKWESREGDNLKFEKEDSPKVLKALRGEISYFRDVMKAFENGDVLDSFKNTADDTMVKIMEEAESIFGRDGYNFDNITDDTLMKLTATQKEAMHNMKSAMDLVIHQLSDNRELRILSDELGRTPKKAYSDDESDEYRILEEVRGAVDDTKSALKDFDATLKRDAKDDTMMRRHFYTLMAFNEASMSAKTLQKRMSYMYAQSNMMKKGEMPTEFKKALDDYVSKMESRGAKIFLTAGNQDGMNYIHRDLYDVLQQTTGLTGGKYTSNASFGGKFMFRRNAEILKTKQSIYVNGQGKREINEYDILLDISSLKTLYPEFLSKIKFSSNDNLKKGNAVEIDLGDLTDARGNANQSAVKMLGSLSLHTALQASAKKVDPSAQAANLVNVWDQAMSLINSGRSVDKAVDNIINGITVEDLTYRSNQTQGIIRSYLNRNFSPGATMVAEKWNDLGVNDTTLYKDNSFTSGERSPGAEAILGGKGLAEMAREFFSINKKYMGTPEKNRLKSLITFFDTISHYEGDIKTAVDKIQSDGKIKSLKRTVTQDEYDSFKHSDFGTQDNFEFKNGKWESVLSEKDVIDKATWSILHSLSGDPANNIDGFITKLKSPTRINESDNRQNVFAINATRFPNHNMGQNTMIFIKGVALGNEGLAIKDNWYTKVFGGDWDGDTLQIIAKSREDLLNVKVDDKKVFGDNDENIIRSIFDWHYTAYESNNTSKGATLKGDKADEKGLGQNPGAGVAGLASASHTEGYWRLGQTDLIDTFNDAFKELKIDISATTKLGELKEEGLIELSVDPVKVDNHSDITIINPMLGRAGNTSVGSMGSIKEIISSDPFSIGPKDNEVQYKIASGWTNDKGSFRSVMMLLEMDNKDFGFKIAKAWKSKEAIDETKKNDFSRGIKNTQRTMLNTVASRLHRSPLKVEEQKKEVAKILGESAGDIMDGLVGKRAINLGIMNLQANSVGVDNVKSYGLYFMARHLTNPKQVVGDIVRTISVSSKFPIADFNSNGSQSRLDVFRYKGSEASKIAAQNEEFMKHSSAFISKVRETIDNGANGKYIPLRDWESILELKKKNTATTTDFLRAIAIVKKHSQSMFSDEKSMSTLSPDLVTIVKILRGVEETFRPTLIKSLAENADENLQRVLSYDNKEDMFNVTREDVDEETGREEKINYYDQLLHAKTLEKTIQSFYTAVGSEGAGAIYSSLLNSNASVGRNYARATSFVAQLRDDMNNENAMHSPVVTRNVYMKKTSDVESLLREMGITLKERTTDNILVSAVEGAKLALGDAEFSSKYADNLMKSGTISNESQYSLSFADKDGNVLNIKQLYGLLTKATYGKDAKNHDEKVLLVTNLIRNLSDASQLALKLYDSGATVDFLKVYQEGMRKSGTPVYSQQDLDNLKERRARSMNDKLGIFDSALAERVESILSTKQILCAT